MSVMFGKAETKAAAALLAGLSALLFSSCGAEVHSDYR